jgi:lipopolysaccharide transport system permease protein
MTKRDFRDRYAGQVLGSFWAFGHPLALTAIYLTAFVVIFPGRLGGSERFPRDSATFVLSGLIAWLAVQEALARGVQALVSNANLIKQVVFPIEVLPVRGALAAVITQSIATALLILYALVAERGLPWTYLLLPPLMLFQALALIGISFVLSVIGAYFRDLKDLVQLFSTVGVFIAPIFYSPALELPAKLRFAFHLNPVSYLVWCYQDVCYYGRLEHPLAWIVVGFGSLACFYGGYRVFQRLKLMLGNVL